MTRVVVIVEDTELGRDVLELALMQLPGLEIRVTSSAEEALECLFADNVCALVTDLNLPRMNGFELIQAVREDPRHSSLPIVVISGDTDPATPARVAQLGADAYFPKPYSPNEVRSRLEQLIHAA